MTKDFIYKDKKEQLEKILNELQSPNLDLEEFNQGNRELFGENKK